MDWQMILAQFVGIPLMVITVLYLLYTVGDGVRISLRLSRGRRTNHSAGRAAQRSDDIRC
jgi:hypothetical protein